jgi:glycosidase
MYKKLSGELHKRGMKLIQDAVYNHVGLYHFYCAGSADERLAASMAHIYSNQL